MRTSEDFPVPRPMLMLYFKSAARHKEGGTQTVPPSQRLIARLSYAPGRAIPFAPTLAARPARARMDRDQLAADDAPPPGIIARLVVVTCFVLMAVMLVVTAAVAGVLVVALAGRSAWRSAALAGGSVMRTAGLVR